MTGSDDRRNKEELKVNLGKDRQYWENVEIRKNWKTTGKFLDL